MIDLAGALRELLQDIGVCASGILDTSSATVPADSTRTEGDDHYNECLLVPIDGTYAGIAKRITDYTGIGGIFTIDPFDPFLGPTGLVPYVVISRPGGGTSPAIVGTLTDAIPPMDQPPNNVYTIMQYCKGIMERVGVTPADPDDSLLTILGQRDAAVAADDLSDVTTTSMMAKLRLLLITAITGHDSSAAISNPDGSIIEREEYIQTQIGYGITPIEADAGSTSAIIIDAATLTQAMDDWWKGALCVSIDGQNNGQSRPIVSSSQAADTITVYPAFFNAPNAGDHFLVISTWRPWVWDQQPDVAVNTTAIVASETDIFDLNDPISSYMINSLRLKFADPGVNTITVRLYELINDVSTVVQTFSVTTANFGTYFSLMDMFGLAHLAGDDLQVTVQVDGGGPYAVTGQYQYAISKNG